MLIEQALGIQILSGGDAATRRLTSGLSLADLVAILVAMARDEDPEVDPATIRRYLSLARVAEITALFSSLFMATLPPTTPPLPAAAKQME